MHTSVVKLRPENITDLAKDVIRPASWYCEWNTSSLQKPVQCRIALNSWAAYLQHLLRHCQQSKGHGNSLVCRLPRCNIPSGLSISTYNELVNHVQQSHLSRSQLCCPIRDCASISFSRPGLLESHFRDAHADLINLELPLSSPVLLPTWRPFRPECSQEPTPPPGPAAPGSGLIPPVHGTPFHRSVLEPARRDTTPMPSSQLSLSSQLSPRKRSQLRPAGSEESVVPAAAEIVFADLPRDEEEVVDCVIRKMVPVSDLARPQDVLDPERYGYRLPPGSILYHNFVRIHGLTGEDNEEDEGKGES